MSGLFASYTDKASAAVDRNRAALTRSTTRLTEHDAARPAGDDADELFAWRRERRDLEDRVESDKEALAFAEAAATKAQDEAAEREADAAHKAEERRAEADRKLITEIDALARKLAAKRDELTASIERTAIANAARGSRPYILDAETRVRQKPGKVIPAEYRDEVVWSDGSGRRPAVFRQGPEGEMIPTEHGFVKKTVRVQTRAERIIPVQMPARLADAIKLVDLEGRPL